MVQRWGGGWGGREEGVQAEVLCECRGQLVTALSQALVCSCRSPHWLHVAQRHQGWPVTEASPSPTMHSLQNRSHQLHFSYLSSVSSKLVFLSYDIHVWSSTAIERFNVVSLCSLSITSCYLLLYSSSLATVLLLHVKQCDESLPPGCLGIPAPYCARAFPLLCIIFGLSLHLSPVCILTLVFIELPCTFQWLLLSVHIARGWQTALICFYKLQSMQWNSEVWLWPYETLLPQSLILM